MSQKTLGRTMWRDKRPPGCLVESLQDPPQEIEGRESYGRLHVKGVDPVHAAGVYRQIKKLSPDWPIQVSVKDSEGKTVSVHRFPEPETQSETVPQKKKRDKEPAEDKS